LIYTVPPVSIAVADGHLVPMAKGNGGGNEGMAGHGHAVVEKTPEAPEKGEVKKAHAAAERARH
jgi:hypothetical protein